MYSRREVDPVEEARTIGSEMEMSSFRRGMIDDFEKNISKFGNLGHDFSWALPS